MAIAVEEAVGATTCVLEKENVSAADESAGADFSPGGYLLGGLVGECGLLSLSPRNSLLIIS